MVLFDLTLKSAGATAVIPGVCAYEMLLIVALGFVGARAKSVWIPVICVFLLFPTTVITQAVYAGSEKTQPWLGIALALLLRAALELFLVVIAYTFFVYFLSFRGKLGHCRDCGYNLTGNTTGRCPECGMSIVPVDD